MTGHDPELDLFRTNVSCAALLERLQPGWELDRKGSTKRALKYRCGTGRVVIVNHEGRGWWDPQSDAKGDVFDLVRFLDPRLNFGQVRQALRPFVGLAPTFPEALRERRNGEVPDRPVYERWICRPRMTRGSATLRYLTGERRLPTEVLDLASAADVLREGPYGSAWFAHHDGEGRVLHVEIRGPEFKGSLSGGTKSLFRLPGRNAQPGVSGTGRVTRLVVTEAPIDALSVAAIENVRADTIYLATGGGMGPGTIHALEELLRGLTGVPSAALVSATDANVPGERYADRHKELAAAAAVGFERLTPTTGTDWNDVLKRQGRGA